MPKSKGRETMRYYKIEDITKATEQVIAHGCNCQGRMGAGVAKAIARKWPKVKIDDKQYHCHRSRHSLRDIYVKLPLRLSQRKT